MLTCVSEKCPPLLDSVIEKAEIILQANFLACTDKLRSPPLMSWIFLDE